jgi:hypothetical protein
LYNCSIVHSHSYSTRGASATCYCLSSPPHLFHEPHYPYSCRNTDLLLHQRHWSFRHGTLSATASARCQSHRNPGKHLGFSPTKKHSIITSEQGKKVPPNNHHYDSTPEVGGSEAGKLALSPKQLPVEPTRPLLSLHRPRHITCNNRHRCERRDLLPPPLRRTLGRGAHCAP